MSVVIRRLRATDGPAAEAIEARCYPHLDSEHRLHAWHVDVHVEVFGDGAFAAEVDGRLAGFALGWLMDFDLDDPEHTLDDVAEPTEHDPDGDWYYGLDISVDPEFRGRGIGRKLYDARKDLVRRLGRRGIVAGGMIPGYRRVMDQLSPERYVDEVVQGLRRDPTLSFQLSNGFEVRGLLSNYVSGTAGDGIATLLVWESGS